jgi:mannose-6-phosphate isomerase
MTNELYPLLLERKIVQPIWGGQRLAAWLDLPEPRPDKLGETWQVYDTNPIRNGPLAGHTLADATKTYGAALVGTRTTERYGDDFPLLAKFIDANDKLSIQVHPNDEYAHTREAATGFHGKTESWYILDAEPGATVTYGLSRPSSREEFANAIWNSELESLMRQIPIQPGDVVFVPAGTLHAINAGIVLFEIQQKSDLTYRVYDYGRLDAKTGQPRELHLEKALDVSEFGPAPRDTISPLTLSDGRDLLIACPYFALERWTFTGEQTLTTDPGSFEILTVIEGRGQLGWEKDAVPLQRGDSIVLPALLGQCRMQALEGPLRLLRAHVPDLTHDYIAPLRAQGIADARIAEVVHQ